MGDICKKFSRMSEKEIKKLLKENLPSKRYDHSLNVAKRAVELAEKYGADSEKAYFAGLVHDCTKGFSHERQKEIIEEKGIVLDEDDLKSPRIWHATAGACYIENKMGVTDSDIINAVRYHTTGRMGMSILEKVIYMADLTSKERDYPDAKYTRKLTDYSLDEGLAYGIRHIVDMLISEGAPVGKDSFGLLKECEKTAISMAKGE